MVHIQKYVRTCNLWFYDFLCLAVSRQLTLDRDLCNSFYCHIEMIGIRKYHYYFWTSNLDLQYLISRIALISKLVIASINPLPWPAAPQIRIIRTLYLLERFIIELNASLFLYWVGALSILIMMVSSLIFQCLKIFSKTWFNREGHGLYHHSNSIRIYFHQVQ